MAFKIQDLMADVLPEPARWAQRCPGGLTCAGGGFAAGSKGGEEKSPKCRPVSRGGAPRPPKPGPQQDYTDLSLLERQLQQALSAAQG